MATKYLVVWLLLLVSCCSAGERVKRIGTNSLFFPSSQPTTYPHQIWKVHKYNGLQLQPLQPPYNTPFRYEVAPLYGVPAEGGVPGSIDLKDYDYSGIGGASTDEQEEPHSTVGGILSLLSLIPGGLSGILSLSSSSSGEAKEAEDRSGLAKGLIKVILKNKKAAAKALIKDGLGIALHKGHTIKNWAKDSSLEYYQYPVVYHRKSLLSSIPIIGRLFGSDHRHYFPIKSSSYFKVDISGPKNPPPPVPVELTIPGTSYGAPDKPVPVPTIRPSEEHFVEHTTAYPHYEPAIVANPEIFPAQVYQPHPQYEPAIETSPEIVPAEVYPPYPQYEPAIVANPEFVPAQVYQPHPQYEPAIETNPETVPAEVYPPYPQYEPAIVANPEFVPAQVYQPHPQYEPAIVANPEIVPVQVYQPYPASVEAVYPYPVSAYPYPPPTFPYSPVDYYETSGSEHKPLKIRPVYKHSEDKKAGSKDENEPENRNDQVDEESSTHENTVEHDQVETKTEVAQSS